jgi:ribonucleotide reductase alpha subunit
MRTIDNIRRFRLSDTFIEPYKDAEVPWGPLGYVTFKRTYARRLSEFETDATGTEEWWQTCRRVVEGMFNMQKQHVFFLGLEWNDAKAQKTAKDAYDRLFNLKWTPPGRGLWMMGTKFIEERTAAGLFNCAFRSTKDLSTKGGYICEPQYTNDTLIIDDSREGWVDSVHTLLDGFFFGSKIPKFDYSAIRPEGAPIHGFGGTSSGHGPLKELHESLTELYSKKVGEPITSVDIVDTENLIGRCVVAGNVRRSAALAMGRHDDTHYLEMKNDSEKLMHHRWGSNNSFNAIVGMDYTWHAQQSQKNGEPGYIWLDNARTRGRFKDKHENLEDYLKTLKIAYLYGKTITLSNTHWPETNAKMLKNRRIGLSQSGVVQAFNKHGRREMYEWCDKAYDFVQSLDEEYSNWLCIPKSIRTTSIKPSGTVSLLNGSTPGIHFPEDEYYIRRIRFSKDSPLVGPLSEAGYKIEDDVYSPNTVCVEFPVHEPYFVKGKRDVNMWEQLEIAAQYQHYWADNSVSITVTFKPEEAPSIKDALEMYESRLKAVSFLRYEETGYEQAPYEPITKAQFEEMTKKITPVHRFETDQEGSGTKFCTNDTCTF